MEADKEKKFAFKILLVGNGTVGKTSIRKQYMGKGFTGDYMKTIGADFASKTVVYKNAKLKLQIFDLAGQDVYSATRKSFYKGGHAAFLVFDVQDHRSLLALQKWTEDCIKYSENTIQSFIVLGNKSDLIQTRQVSQDMAIEFLQTLAGKFGITFHQIDTSAVTGENIELAFEIMAKRLLVKRGYPADIAKLKGGITISPEGVQKSLEKDITVENGHPTPKENNAILLDKLNVLEDALFVVAKKVEILENKINYLIKSLN